MQSWNLRFFVAHVHEAMCSLRRHEHIHVAAKAEQTSCANV